MGGKRPVALVCSRCGAERAPSPEPATLCPCGAPLLARYDLERLRPEARALRERIAARPPDLWRYAELLPDVEPVSLGEGFTPLLPAARLGGALGLDRVLVKDEARNPTGSFKAR